MIHLRFHVASSDHRFAYRVACDPDTAYDYEADNAPETWATLSRVTCPACIADPMRRPTPEPIPCPGCDEGPRCQCWNTAEGRVCGVCETPVRGERCLGTFEFAAVGAC